MAGISSLQRPSVAVFLVGMLLVLFGCSSGTPTFDSVLIPGDDGTVLRGRLYGQGTTAVVLVHDDGSTQKVWEPLANTLAERGFMVLTYDMRGQGESPGKREIGIAAADTAAAVRYLNKSAQRKQVMVAGVGVGGTAALKTAAQEQVLGVATLSAYSEYRGLSAAQDIPRITAPKLFIAAKGDPDASATAKTFQNAAKKPVEILEISGALRGEALKSGLPQDAREALVGFLTKNKGT